MKAIPLTLAATILLVTTSCTGMRGSGVVPDMPYTGTAATAAPAPVSTPPDEPKAMSDAQLLPPMDGITPTVSPSPAPIPAPTPAVSPTPTYGSALMTPATPTAPTTPAVSPSPTVKTNYAPVPSQPSTPSYTPPAATPAASSSVLVAKKVPGDPHRVYNPYKPTQVIRITNPKTGEPFPSGKVLGIPNSTNKFMVP